MEWDSESDTNQSLQDQIRANEVELHARKESLAKQRLAIIKSQGQPNFTGSGVNKPITGTPTGM